LVKPRDLIGNPSHPFIALSASLLPCPCREPSWGWLTTITQSLSLTPYVPHAEGKIALGRFNEKVVVVRHETIGMTDPVITFIDVLKGIEKHFPIMVIFKNGFLFVPAGSDVVDSTCVFDTKWTGHEPSIAA
jgi:hypothetical protein